MVSSTCLKEKLVVFIKGMSIYCEVCECNIKKSNWGKHLKTTKHGITSVILWWKKLRKTVL